MPRPAGPVPTFESFRSFEPRRLLRSLLLTLGCVAALSALGCTAAPTSAADAKQSDLWNTAQRGYASNDGVRIHYATVGEGPLVVMIHGFPDFWYSWRHQMAGLADAYQVVAIDQRGYNRSSAPAEETSYAMRHLVADVAAVINHLGHERAVIVGHDWGGAVAWQVAFNLPQMVDKLVVLNLPHPQGLSNAVAASASARADTGYAQRFRAGSASDPDIFFGGPMTAQSLSGWVTDPAARARYVEAFERSDFDAMLAYYKQNYPPAPPPGSAAPDLGLPPLTMPVLMFHGLRDRALPAAGLNGTWNWIDADFTLVTAPDAEHFVQQDAAALVTRTLRSWLDDRR